MHLSGFFNFLCFNFNRLLKVDPLLLERYIFWLFSFTKLKLCHSGLILPDLSSFRFQFHLYDFLPVLYLFIACPDFELLLGCHFEAVELKIELLLLMFGLGDDRWLRLSLNHRHLWLNDHLLPLLYLKLQLLFPYPNLLLLNRFSL